MPQDRLARWDRAYRRRRLWRDALPLALPLAGLILGLLLRWLWRRVEYECRRLPDLWPESD